MTDQLYIDTETFSDVPLKNGTVAYASSPAFEVMLVSYALNDEPARVWDMTAESMPDDLDDALSDGTVRLIAHNSFFDRTALNHDDLAQVIDFSIPRWRCTMVQAFAHGLPGKLDVLSTILGLPTEKQKLKTGKDLINLFCKPRPKTSELRRATRETHPEQWAQFVEYSRVDTEALREVHRRLPTWNYPDNRRELELWFLDQKINDRGVQLDLELAAAAVRATMREKNRLNKFGAEATDDYLEKITSRDLLTWLLAEHGVDLPDLQASTLERRVADENLPRELRELLAMRMQAGMTSHTKYLTAINCASTDGRARGLLQFAGAARTERWAGRVLQPQNFVRPTLQPDEIEFWIRALKADAEGLV